MTLRNVTVIGGGPAGLFASILLRRSHPSLNVTVFERSVPDETFGFGVALTRRTLDLLATADHGVVRRLRQASVAMPPQEMRVGPHAVRSSGNEGGICIARSALLEALLDEARACGVRVELGREMTLDETGDADLVIAADGVASAVRAALPGAFGERLEDGRGLFMWLGCDRRLEANLFAPAVTEHGLFNIHCYPYAEGRSTIGVETDPATWRRAGMDRWTGQTPVRESDKLSLAYLQDVFGEVLGGATLLGNRSRWTHFRTVTAQRWSAGNVVLIGDAAHTAHYSVGSGTKMAMEDAVSLAAALGDSRHESVQEALRAYETDRRPRVERLQELADRSRWWWESLEHRLDLPVEALMLSYLSRGGAVPATRVAESDAALVDTALTARGLDGGGPPPGGSPLERRVLDSAVRAGGIPFASRLLPHRPDGLEVREVLAQVRDPWGPEAKAVVATAHAAAAEADVVVLTGPADRPALLDRLALAEHVRRGCDAAVAVEGAREHTGDLVDGVIARRTDLVRFASPADTADTASTSTPSQEG